jgi:hypothetical protein
MRADYHTAAALTSTRARQIRRSLPSARCLRDEQPAISTVYEMIFPGAASIRGSIHEHEDVASASLLENWIDEAERRTWFLFEATRKPLSGGD